MKFNKKNIFVKIVLVIIISMSICLSFGIISEVKADSGWDTDYGSSSDSGSWDSGSWDSDGGGVFECTTPECLKVHKIADNIFNWIIICFWPAIIILFIITNVAIDRKFKKSHKIYNYKQISVEEANSVISNFDIKEFNHEAYKIFYDVQIAWMNFDYDKLRELLTDELYNSYIMQLENLKLKNSQNVMNGFELVEMKLISLKEQNEYYIAKIVLEVKFCDCVKSTVNNRVLRGNAIVKVDNTYILTFVKSKEDQKEEICPCCGAPVEGNVSGVCEYCKSKLVNKTHDWVMSKKEKIDQK